MELKSFWLLPNFPPALDGLAKAMKSDAVMFRVLTSHGFVQFGRAPQYNYDPLCFDLNSRSPDGDCPIVQFDHEEILIHERLSLIAVLADSFRKLIQQTIG
jgi:hypothetical protein